MVSSNASPSAPQYESSNASYQPNEEAYEQDLKALVQAGLEFDVKAELEVGFGAFVERFTSRVQGTPGESVKVSWRFSLFHSLLSGSQNAHPHRNSLSLQATAENSPLFYNLSTTWSFQPASATSPHPSTTTSTSIPHSAPSPSPTAPTSTEVSPLPHPLSPRDYNTGPTLLTIDLSFSFASPIHRIAAQSFLPKVSDLMVSAFEKRCVQVYGKGQS